MDEWKGKGEELDVEQGERGKPCKEGIEEKEGEMKRWGLT